MSKDTKQKGGEEHTTSLSSLSIFSPAVTKNDNKTLDFGSAANHFLSHQLLQHIQFHHQKCESLNFIAQQPKIAKEYEGLQMKPLHHSMSKYQKGNQESEFDYIPLVTKQKIQEPFEIPELTAQSLLQSEQFDMDNESNTTDLPLSSIRRHKIERVFHEQSEGSDDMLSFEGSKKLLHHKEQYAQSKGSDISESDDLPAICRPCFNLIERCKLLQNQNGELIKQNQALKDQLVKCQQKSRLEMQRQKQQSESKQISQMSACALKEYFLIQAQQFCKILGKVNGLLQSFSINFSKKQCQLLEQLSKECKKIDENVLQRSARNQRKLQIQKIHNNYKKIISMMVKNCSQKEEKRQMDFKRVMATITKKAELDAQNRAFELKSDKSRKRSKCFTEKQELNEIEEHLKLIQQNRQKIEWLELNYRRQKSSALSLQTKYQALQTKYNGLQSKYQQLQQKYKMQVNQLITEKNMYHSQISKYHQDLSAFMLTINHHQHCTIYELDFFKNLSQRIYQISNCIPFEDNDEQNLFPPENEAQLFDMIERIHRFYMRIEDYNLKRDSQFEAEKSSFTLFLKELVQTNKVSSDYILNQMLENKKYERLNYLKGLIQASRRNLRTHSVDPSFSENSRMLKIQRARSFTYHSLNSD